MIRPTAYFFAAILPMLLAACANRVPPDGGPRDRTAPVVLSTIPASKSTEVEAIKFEFEFDEFVQLKDGGNGILVSPPPAKPPVAVLQGKKLILKMSEKLDSNTTYTITVGASVSDLTENNPLEPYSMVFSTGKSLDSLSCFGSVVDAFSGIALKDILVMLYRDDNDSLPKTSLPRYFARTDANGNFRILNVKSGLYKVFALKDANSNYLYDQPGELIGFTPKPVQIDTAETPLGTIRVSAERPEKQRLVKYEYHQPGNLQLKYALAPDSLAIQSFTDGTLSFFRKEKGRSDSLSLYFRRFEGDSVQLYVNNFIGNEKYTDTLEFKARKAALPSKKGRQAARADTVLRFTSNIEARKLMPGEALVISGNYPFFMTDSARVKRILAGDTVQVSLPERQDDFSYKFPALPADGKALLLMVEPGSFVDLYQHVNDTLRFDFRQMEDDETGNIELLFNDSSLNPQKIIIELLDSKSQVMLRMNALGSDSLFIKSLRPGTYKLRAFEDLNGDEEWNSCIYSSKTQAERVFHYKEDIAVRAGWDIAIEWQINAVGQKKRPDKPVSEE